MLIKIKNNNNLINLFKQQMFIIFNILFLFLLLEVKIVNGRQRRDLPLSMDKEMLPPQYFDEEAPTCLAEREPCGFYSFSLDGKAPLKWIKSWCRCSYKHECVYERTDMRMRVYRQTCVSKSEISDNEDKILEGYQRIDDEDLENNNKNSPKHHHHHHHHRKNRRHLHKLNHIKPSMD